MMSSVPQIVHVVRVERDGSPVVLQKLLHIVFCLILHNRTDRNCVRPSLAVRIDPLRLKKLPVQSDSCLASFGVIEVQMTTADAPSALGLAWALQKRRRP